MCIIVFSFILYDESRIAANTRSHRRRKLLCSLNRKCKARGSRRGPGGCWQGVERRRRRCITGAVVVATGAYVAVVVNAVTIGVGAIAPENSHAPGVFRGFFYPPQKLAIGYLEEQLKQLIDTSRFIRRSPAVYAERSSVVP